MNYNTSYHTSLGCDPSRVIHGPAPYNVLDIKTGICPQETPTTNSQIAEVVSKQTEIIFQDVRKNTMQAYIKYKVYYDRKTNASKLNEQHYVYVLQPKQLTNEAKFPSQTSDGWAPTLLTSPYRITVIWLKTRNEQTPSPLLPETTAVHALPTHTRRANNITGIQT